MLVLLLIVSLGLVGCSNSSREPTIGRQISGNQALLLSLQNAVDLNDLYLPYNGAAQNLGNAQSGDVQGSGTVMVGEINLLVQNRGGAATAGGLFVSGYDPNLITVRSPPGEDQINDAVDENTCVKDVIISTDGKYDVTVFCQKRDGISIGGRTTSGANGESTTITVGNLPLGQYLRSAVEQITGENAGWITRSGLFDNARVDCTFRDGGEACRIGFGAVGGDNNRALYGYLLLNMFADDIRNCKNGCRVFPPRFASGQVLAGVSPEYPNGDAFYVNYQILVNRDKWPTLLNELKQRIQITACYYYTTTITPTVCVDPDPSSRRNDPCDAAAPLVWKGSQGAPISVTRIQGQSVAGGTMFNIDLRHVGNGQFWKPDSLAQCGPYSPGRPDPSRRDAVQLLSARIAGDLQGLRCTPSDAAGSTIIRFQNGVGRLSCFYPLSGNVLQSRQAYLSALTLEFGYLYQNVITQDVVIHRT